MCHKRPSGRPQIKGLHPPLIFLKRLSDILEDEVERLGGEFGDKEIAADLSSKTTSSCASIWRGRRYWGSATDGGAREGATEKLLGN